MPLLFSYGTLQDEHVQLSLFGRTLVGQKDALVGYERGLVRINDPLFAQTSGETHHAILRPTQNEADRVEGVAFEVTDQELERADLYEPVEYKRILAKLASGGQAWVYVDAQIGNRPS